MRKIVIVTIILFALFVILLEVSTHFRAWMEELDRVIWVFIIILGVVFYLFGIRDRSGT